MIGCEIPGCYTKNQFVCKNFILMWGKYFGVQYNWFDIDLSVHTEEVAWSEFLYSSRLVWLSFALIIDQNVRYST